MERVKNNRTLFGHSLFPSTSGGEDMRNSAHMKEPQMVVKDVEGLAELGTWGIFEFFK